MWSNPLRWAVCMCPLALKRVVHLALALSQAAAPSVARSILVTLNMVLKEFHDVTHIMPSMRHSALSLFPRFLDASARLRSPAV